MKIILKKYLLIPILLLILELSFGLFSQHIMQSEPYLTVQKSVDNFMFNARLGSFKSSKRAYKANENISFNIELNKKSHLYLVTLKGNQACLLFPTYQENNVFEKGVLRLSSDNLKVSRTQTGEQEFVLLASQNALEFPRFKTTSCIERNKGLKVQQALENNGAEVLELNVRVD